MVHLGIGWIRGRRQASAEPWREAYCRGATASAWSSSVPASAQGEDQRDRADEGGVAGDHPGDVAVGHLAEIVLGGEDAGQVVELRLESGLQLVEPAVDIVEPAVEVALAGDVGPAHG